MGVCGFLGFGVFWCFELRVGLVTIAGWLRGCGFWFVLLCFLGFVLIVSLLVCRFVRVAWYSFSRFLVVGW